MNIQIFAGFFLTEKKLHPGDAIYEKNDELKKQDWSFGCFRSSKIFKKKQTQKS